MNPPRRRRPLRLIVFLACGLLLLALLGAAWMWQGFQRSLPPLDGAVTLSGLGAAARLERDALGIANIHAATAADAARLLGYAHGQDRFFQMDVSRRRAAGELSALLGKVALEADRGARVHRFRVIAGEVLAREPAERRALLQAYAAGVNAGIRSLGSVPWEYRVLRTEPAPWEAVDSILVIYAMAFDLQETAGLYDLTVSTLRDQLGPAGVEFFNPLIGPEDAALDGSVAPLPPPPSPRVINLRHQTSENVSRGTTGPHPDRLLSGSNALLVAGADTESGAALLAGDPHLDLRVPNTFYRAQLQWTDAAGSPVRVVGASIPGVPGIVIGSNGYVAWSLTNSYADTGDLVALDLNPTAPELFYHRGREMLEFERRVDTIEVKDDDPVEVETYWTVWGPVVGSTARGKNLAYRWTLHDPAAVNYAWLDLARAQTLEEALAVAHRAGIPPHNFFVASRDGRAAWTIAGQLPRRFGHDGRFPVSWSYGDRGWDGFLPPEEVPVEFVSSERPLWSGNQRKVAGEALRLLGDAGFDEPMRAQQLRDLLAQKIARETPVRPIDLLELQLNVRGRWLERWRDRLLATLDGAALDGQDARREFRQLIAAEGDLEASTKSIAYRLLRAWHNEMRALTLEPIFARSRRAYPEFNHLYLRTEDALWALHEQEPMHLLSPDYASWRDLRLAAVDAAIDELRERAGSLDDARWGERNRAAIRHPFGSALPFGLSRRLDLPPDLLPGDKNMPRVQSPSFGASLRIVVAPGHEEAGLFHLPGGQSGHPLSPFYLAGHAAWVAGEPTPLLAGEPEHTLTFAPQL